MVTTQFATRQALPADQSRIANLMYFETQVHRHLDWRTPLDWLGAPEYWILEQYGVVSAALACPPDPENIAWLRLLAVSSSIQATQAWRALWDVAQDSLRERDLTVAAIVTHNWLSDLLLESGFTEYQKVVILAQNGAAFPWQANPRELSIRSMTREDLPHVAALDAAAFAPLWQNSLASLHFALSQAEISTVGVLDGEIVAYQMSTRNPFGAHLARLAVNPQYQGQRIGYLMAQDLLQKIQALGLTRLTVNTQNDNSASLALYEKIGFKRTGEQYCVFTRSV
jgi:ribosomal protein S18 acetylase RimI-like enzyme